MDTYIEVKLEELNDDEEDHEDARTEEDEVGRPAATTLRTIHSGSHSHHSLLQRLFLPVFASELT